MQNRREPQRPIQITLLGGPSVGKTAISNSLDKQPFHECRATIGLDFITLKRAGANPQRLQIWDTTSSELFSDYKHQIESKITESKVVLYCIDLSQIHHPHYQNSINQELEVFKEGGAYERSSVIIIGTKLDTVTDINVSLTGMKAINPPPNTRVLFTSARTAYHSNREPTSADITQNDIVANLSEFLIINILSELETQKLRAALAYLPAHKKSKIEQELAALNKNFTLDDINAFYSHACVILEGNYPTLMAVLDAFTVSALAACLVVGMAILFTPSLAVYALGSLAGGSAVIAGGLRLHSLFASATLAREPLEQYCGDLKQLINENEEIPVPF